MGNAMKRKTKALWGPVLRVWTYSGQEGFLQEVSLRLWVNAWGFGEPETSQCGTGEDEGESGCGGRGQMV